MNDHAAVAADLEPAHGLSQIERVVDAFVAPTKTFTDILRSTSWWLPFLLLVLITLGVNVAVDRQVGFLRVSENMVHNSPKQEEALSSLTPEQRAARMQISSKITRYISYGSPVLILVFSAIGALGLWATFNFGLGARTTFGQMLCLWMYCSLPRLLGGLLTILLLFFGGNAENFNLQDQVGTNIGYYLTDPAPWLKSAMSFFDILSFWVMLLMIIGTSIVAKVSKGKAAAVILGWWVIILAISVASAAAFS